MILIVCSSCSVGLRVSGDPVEMDSLLGQKSDWYPDKYPCYSCRRPVAELLDAADPVALKVVEITDLTASEAFSALHGLGLPSEQDCGPTAVKSLLETSKVVKADCQLIKGTNRSVIYSLTFDNGSTLYLGSSPYGATAYRISDKRSYVKEELHGR